MKSRSLWYFARHVLDEQRPRNFAALDQRLVHAEHVASPIAVRRCRANRARAGCTVRPASRCRALTGRPSRDRGCRCRPCSSPPGTAAPVPWWCRVRDPRRCRGNCCPRCCAAAGSNTISGLPSCPTSFACLALWCMWCGIGPMLSKNFEYTGQRLYFFQIRSPTIMRAAFGHCLPQREPLSADHAIAQAFVRRAAFIGGGAWWRQTSVRRCPPRFRP